MKKNFTKVMAMGMVMTILAGTTAFAAEQPMLIAAKPATDMAYTDDMKEQANFLMQSGKVTEIDASVTDGVTLVTTENEQGGFRFAVDSNSIIVNRADGAYLTVADLTVGMEVAVITEANAPVGMSLPAYLGGVTAVVANADAGSMAVGHFDAELTDMNIRLQLNIDEKTTPIKNVQGSKIRLGAEDVKGQDALVFYDITTRSIPAQTNPSFVLLLTQNEIEADVTEVKQAKMVPLREAAEANGYTVKWQGKQNPILLTKGETTMEITVGSDTYVVDGDMVMTADMPSELRNGVTFVCADLFA